MPNYTDNLGLIQPLGSEKIRIAQINQNMDTIDEAVGAVGERSLQQQILDIGGGIAIMANGNTHPAIAAGQFVFVRNHSTLADGAYTANSNIAENAALSSSNLTAVPGGGFNALKAGITSLSDQIGTKIKVFSNFTTPSTEDGELTGGTLDSGYTVICARVYTAGQNRSFNFGQKDTTVYALGLIESYRNKPASLIAGKL